jgi:hypothetical protein
MFALLDAIHFYSLISANAPPTVSEELMLVLEL